MEDLKAMLAGIKYITLDFQDFKDLVNFKGFYESIKDTLTVGTKEIALMNGYLSGTMLKYHRYLLPAFGVQKCAGKRKLKWTLEEFYRWQQIPVEQRKAEYERLHALGEL